ncbi:MAG: DUF1294 domain-containing protein [Clostridia bacterium]|nr:DUF1294 domain-containing protein [Clostridia bacterium]
MYIPLPYVLVYLAAINLLAFLTMAVDKRRAKKKKSRVPEAHLMWLAAVGGAPLALLAMYTLRHKTRHRKFTWGVPALLLLQVAAVVLVTYKGWWVL